jgi:hypothetical protein
VHPSVVHNDGQERVIDWRGPRSAESAANSTRHHAVLNTRTSDVVGQTAARHASDDFTAFLAKVVDMQPQGFED